MQAEAAAAPSVPMFSFNLAVSKDRAAIHAGALLSAVRDLVREIGELHPEDINADSVRSRAWAASYLVAMAEAITDAMAS
jgi:hypothetical protein